MRVSSSFLVCDQPLRRKNTDYEYWIILCGSLKLKGRGRSFELKAQDCMEIPKDTEIEILPKGSCTAGILELSDFDTLDRGLKLYPRENDSVLRKTFLFYIEMQGVQLPMQDRIQMDLEQLLFDVMLSSAAKTSSVNPYVKQVIEDILAHYREPDYTPAGAIRATGYSPSQIRKLFKEETGESPNTFLTGKRIHQAIERMRMKEKNLSIRQIALECGFTDPYYFSRIFRKRMGLSPSEYLEKLSEERDIKD